MYFDAYSRIQNITVHGMYGEDALTGATQYKNLPYWSIDTNTIKTSLQELNPKVEVLSVRKRFPDELSIVVKKLYPMAYIVSGDGYLLLSHEGHILEKGRETLPTDIPEIYYYQNLVFSSYRVGTDIDIKEVRDALYFMEVLEKNGEHVVDIDIEGYHMLGLNTETHQFVFSSEKDRDTQAYQCDQALRQFLLTGDHFVGMDFRFEKPVVKF